MTGIHIFQYMNGENLDDFKENIARYEAIVTYTDKCFEIPFIENYLGITMNRTYIDLRYILRSLWYSCGSKGCERQMGLECGGGRS